MSKTKIEWTDTTWNPVTGCTKVSEGCRNCYAEKIANRFWGDRKFSDVICHEDRLDQPLKWRKPRRVFVNSMSDLFHEDVPEAFICQIFRTMAKANQNTFQILTKRPERMKRLLSFPSTIRERAGRDVWCEKFPKERQGHIWLGVSVENREQLKRVQILRETPAAIRFVSIEPLLEDLGTISLSSIDWVIVGGESGSKSRPMEAEWARSIRDQCKDAGVPFFFKQGSQNNWTNFKEVDFFPSDLMIREFPK